MKLNNDYLFNCWSTLENHVTFEWFIIYCCWSTHSFTHLFNCVRVGVCFCVCFFFIFVRFFYFNASLEQLCLCLLTIFLHHYCFYLLELFFIVFFFFNSAMAMRQDQLLFAVAVVVVLYMTRIYFVEGRSCELWMVYVCEAVVFVFCLHKWARYVLRFKTN